MSLIIGLASLCVSLYVVLSFHSFENTTIMVLLAIAYSTLLFISRTYEERIKKRIEALEKRLSDKEKGVNRNE